MVHARLELFRNLSSLSVCVVSVSRVLSFPRAAEVYLSLTIDRGALFLLLSSVSNAHIAAVILWSCVCVWLCEWCGLELVGASQ